jgi:hypothetical protein
LKALLAAILMMLALPVAAAEWGHYENARFGFAVDIPPEFGNAQEALNGDGRIYASGDGRAVLRIYGGNIVEADFEAALATAMGHAESDGWALSYQRVTPGWASYSGTRNGQILYARAIAACGGSQYASFELVYPAAEVRAYDPVVERLVRSLRATGAC